MNTQPSPQYESIWIRARRRLAHWLWSPLPASEWQASEMWHLDSPVPPPDPIAPVIPRLDIAMIVHAVVAEIGTTSEPGLFSRRMAEAIRERSQPLHAVQPTRPVAPPVRRILLNAQAVRVVPVSVPIRRDIIVTGSLSPIRPKSEPLQPIPVVAHPMPAWRNLDAFEQTGALDELTTLASGRRNSDTLEVPAIYRKKVAEKHKESE